MPKFWEYPGKDGNAWSKESTSVHSDGAGDQDEANMTVDIIVTEKPVKNMQPFRETVSEFEMFTRAGSPCVVSLDLFLLAFFVEETELLWMSFIEEPV